MVYYLACTGACNGSTIRKMRRIPSRTGHELASGATRPNMQIFCKRNIHEQDPITEDTTTWRTCGRVSYVVVVDGLHAATISFMIRRKNADDHDLHLQHATSTTRHSWAHRERLATGARQDCRREHAHALDFEKVDDVEITRSIQCIAEWNC